MKEIALEPDWPPLWKNLHNSDCAEIWMSAGRRGPQIGYLNRFQLVLRLFQQYVPVGARVLDVAAAQGNHTLALAERGYLMTWNDLREEIAGYVQLKHEAGKVRYTPGDVFEVDLDAPFDAVLIGEVIEHVAHPDRFLERIAALVRPGGVIVMTTPNGAFFRNTLPRWSDYPDPSVFEEGQFKPDADGHIFLLWPDEIRRLTEDASLALEEFVLFNNLATMGCYRLDAVLSVLPRFVVMWLDRLSQAAPSAIAERLMFHAATVWRKSEA